MSSTGLLTDRLPITAAVLAGGRSLRMGTDKTLLAINDKPMIVRVVSSVLDICEHVLVITNRPDALSAVDLPPAVEILTDAIAYQGPLGGLATAFSTSSHEWVLAIAADMPWVSHDVIRALWEAREGADVVIPVTDRGLEPLLALYRVSATGPAAQEVLAAGRRRIVAMFPSLVVAELPLAQVQAIDPTFTSFFNMNTPADLAEVCAREPAEPARRAEALPVTGDPTKESRDRRSVRILHAARDTNGMPSERPITIYLNDIEVATVQATVEHVDDMAIGFLVTEGLLHDREALVGIDVDTKHDLVYVTSQETVPEGLVHNTSKRYVTSGCGKGITFSSVGHARGLAPVSEGVSVEPVDLHDWIAEMATRSEDYRETGGYHSCGLVIDGELVLVREDVGRHNAADKLIGRAWLDRLPMDRAVLLSTGRLSYEMTVKAAKSKIPIVASRSAATDLSAQIADELGITLVGYVRGGKILIYTHPNRIVGACDA